MPHITTQYHFVPELYRRIRLKSHLRASRFKFFPWVLTFGYKHIVRPPNQTWGWTPPCKNPGFAPDNVVIYDLDLFNSKLGHTDLVRVSSWG
jgi:hypothetical protein